MSRVVEFAALALALLSVGVSCGGGSDEAPTPATRDEIVTDLVECFRQSGAQVNTNPLTLELEAYWGPVNYTRLVKVSTDNTYEVGDVSIPYPDVTRASGLTDSDQQALDDCFAKYEDPPE